MAGVQGQPARQIAGRSSDRQCNYAEPPAKALREGPAWPAGLRAPHPLPEALTLPDPQLQALLPGKVGEAGRLGEVVGRAW